jgi:hypothetical protein
MDFNGYEIFVTAQTLPKLASPWTRVDLVSGTFYFKRTTDVSKPFTISGYISKDTMANTKDEADGLNEALAANPSGTFTDGFGDTWTVLVDDYEIAPIAGVNKYTFSMSLRIVG